MTAPSNSISSEPLSREDCLNLLRSADLARIVLSVRCLPAALPARISLMDEDHLLFASGESAVILAARRGDVISVQIDGLDPDGTTWSVMVSGIATNARDDELLSTQLKNKVDRGAMLMALPLSVLVGQRGH